MSQRARSAAISTLVSVFCLGTIGCGQEEVPYKPRAAAAGPKANLPAAANLPKRPLKIGDAWTVWGASYSLRSRVHRKEVANKRISITGYIVKNNMTDAPECAVHKGGKADPEDADAHEALLCVQSGSSLADPKRFKFDADDFYLKSPQEMREVWRELPEACDNTLLIAERCHVEFAEGANLMPQFPVPDGESEESWLVKEVELGLQKRFRGAVPDEVRRQAEYEVGVIIQMGFPGYFLVTADLVAHAKSVGIRVGPGRGSAAHSWSAATASFVVAKRMSTPAGTPIR